MTPAKRSSEHHQRSEPSKRALVVARSLSAGKKAGANASRAGDALVRAVSRLVNRAVDDVLLGDKRVASAAEGSRLLSGEEHSEALADDIQRIVLLAVHGPSERHRHVRRHDVRLHLQQRLPLVRRRVRDVIEPIG